jgi:hypothetical protein
MGRGKKSTKGGCSICSSQRRIWKQNKKERLKVKEKIRKDKVLNDILLNPYRSKVRINKKLLNQLKDEQWST